MADEKELNYEKSSYFVETKAHFQTILKYKEARSRGDANAIREELGEALVAVMKKEDLFVRLLSTPFTPESAYNRSMSDSDNNDQYGLQGSMKTQEDLDEEEVRNLVRRYNKITLDDVCLHLRGALLSGWDGSMGISTFVKGANGATKYKECNTKSGFSSLSKSKRDRRGSPSGYRR